MRHSSPSPTPQTFEEDLAALPPDRRAALEKLRRAVRAAAPAAVECISYGLAAFRLNGKFFVGLGATPRHCSFHLGATVQTHPSPLKGYDTSKGTIRFQSDQPLPAALVRKLVQARIAENARFAQPAPKRLRNV